MDQTRLTDFLGNPFTEFTCKCCKKQHRRMKHDKLMPVCPTCEPEDAAEFQRKMKRH